MYLLASKTIKNSSLLWYCQNAFKKTFGQMVPMLRLYGGCLSVKVHPCYMMYRVVFIWPRNQPKGEVWGRISHEHLGLGRRRGSIGSDPRSPQKKTSMSVHRLRTSMAPESSKEHLCLRNFVGLPPSVPWLEPGFHALSGVW